MPAAAANSSQLPGTAMIITTRMQLDSQPDPPCKVLLQPEGISRLRIFSGYPQHKAGCTKRFQIGTQQMVAALDSSTASAGDQRTERGIVLAVSSQQHEVQAIGQPQLAADDELYRMVPGSDMGTDDAGDGTFVGQRQRCVTERGGLLDKFSRMRRPAQKTVVADAMQFGICRETGTTVSRRCHADTSPPRCADPGRPTTVHHGCCAPRSNRGAHRLRPTSRFLCAPGHTPGRALPRAPAARQPVAVTVALAVSTPACGPGICRDTAPIGAQRIADRAPGPLRTVFVNQRESPHRMPAKPGAQSLQQTGQATVRLQFTAEQIAAGCLLACRAAWPATPAA